MDSLLLTLQSGLQRFWLEPLWFLLPVLTLILLALVVLLPGLFDAARSRKRLGVFKRIAHDSMHDVLVPDGLGGDLYIAHLLLLPDGIAVFNEKPFAGKIFGDTNVDQWTQAVRQRSFRFANPLVELQEQVIAINGLLGQRCVSGYLVFSDDSEFPWGKPDNVYLRKELDEAFAKDVHPTQEDARQSWLNLQQLGVSGTQLRTCYRRYVVATLLLLAAMVWLMLAWYGAAPALDQ